MCPAQQRHRQGGCVSHSHCASATLHSGKISTFHMTLHIFGSAYVFKKPCTTVLRQMPDPEGPSSIFSKLNYIGLCGGPLPLCTAGLWARVAPCRGGAGNLKIFLRLVLRGNYHQDVLCVNVKHTATCKDTSQLVHACVC